MSVQNEGVATGESVVLQGTQAGGVYASLFEKINLNPVTTLSALDTLRSSVIAWLLLLHFARE